MDDLQKTKASFQAIINSYEKIHAEHLEALETTAKILRSAEQQEGHIVALIEESTNTIKMCRRLIKQIDNVLAARNEKDGIQQKIDDADWWKNDGESED